VSEDYDLMEALKRAMELRSPAAPTPEKIESAVEEVQIALPDYAVGGESPKWKPLIAKAFDLARRLDEALLFIAETGKRLTDPMYDDVGNREGLAIDCQATAGEEVNMDYLEVEWQTKRAISAEAALKEAQGLLRRLIKWEDDYSPEAESLKDILDAVQRHLDSRTGKEHG
jgi:hypothetical protein